MYTYVMNSLGYERFSFSTSSNGTYSLRPRSSGGCSKGEFLADITWECKVQCPSLKHSVAVTQCSVIAPGVLGHAFKALHPTVLQEREYFTHWIIGVLTNEALMAARGE